MRQRNRTSAQWGWFAVAAACSLALSLAVAVLWAESYWFSDHLELNRTGQRTRAGVPYASYGVHSWRGTVSIFLAPKRETLPAKVSAAPNGWQWTHTAVPSAVVGRPGVLQGLIRFRVERYGDGAYVQLPHWLVMCMGLAPAAAWLGRRWRRRREQAELERPGFPMIPRPADEG